MDPIYIEVYSTYVRQKIAVNEALLKHGVKATIDDINKELDKLSSWPIEVSDILKIIEENLNANKEFVDYNLATYYLEVAICFYVMEKEHPVAYLHYLASEDDTNEDFIKIENKELIPLGGAAMDYKEYKQAARKIIKHINEQNEFV